MSLTLISKCKTSLLKSLVNARTCSINLSNALLSFIIFISSDSEVHNSRAWMINATLFGFLHLWDESGCVGRDSLKPLNFSLSFSILVSETGQNLSKKLFSTEDFGYSKVGTVKHFYVIYIFDVIFKNSLNMFTLIKLFL